MKLTHDQILDAPIDDVWANFMDLYRIGQAFPGAEVTEVEGDDFVGNIRAKLGPLRMTFVGEGTMTERDTDARRARIEATGREQHGFGNANIAITVHLSDHAAGESTRVLVITDLVLVGLPMDFGSAIVQRASDPSVERFLTRMGSPDGATPHDDDDAFDIARTAADLLGSFTGRRRRPKKT